MMTWTTMVLLILVETTLPILVLRWLICFAVAVSAIYFFLVLAVAVLVFLPFTAWPALAFALLAATGFFRAAAGFAAAFLGAAAGAPASDGWPLLGPAMPNCFSRITV